MAACSVPDPLSLFLQDYVEENAFDFIGGKFQINTTSCEGSNNSMDRESASISGRTLSNNDRNECSIKVDVGFTVAPASDSAPNPPGPPNSITSSSLIATEGALTMNVACTDRVEKKATAIDFPSALEDINSSNTSDGNDIDE